MTGFHLLTLNLKFPLFSNKFEISPLFRKTNNFSIVLAISLCFRSNYVFLPTCTLRVFLPPYFDHGAFMHHTIHVLDAHAA